MHKHYTFQAGSDCILMHNEQSNNCIDELSMGVELPKPASSITADFAIRRLLWLQLRFD